MKLDSSETVFSSQELLRFVILLNFRYIAYKLQQEWI
jgi:hypothetical protein